MTEFVEIHERKTKATILYPIDLITAIVCNKDGDVYIETGTGDNDLSAVIFVSDNYEDIKKQIVR